MNNIPIGAWSYIKKDFELWFAACNCNGLFSYDLLNNELKCRHLLDNDISSNVSRYFDINYVQGFLILVPMAADEIALYEVATDRLLKLPLETITRPDQKIPYNDGFKFCRSVVVGNTIYLLPITCSTVIAIDFPDLRIRYIDTWVSAIDEVTQSGEGKGYFTDGNIICNNKLYLPIGCYSGLFVLNLLDESFYILDVDTKYSGIAGISLLEDGRFILTGRGDLSNEVTIIDIESKEKVVIELPSRRKLEDPFYAPLVSGNNVYILPISDDKAYEIDLKSMRVGEITKINEVLGNDEKDRRYYQKITSYFLDGDIIRFCTGQDLMWHEYDVKTRDMVNYYFHDEEYTKLVYSDLLRKELVSNNLIFEGAYTIGNFLDTIARL